MKDYRHLLLDNDGTLMDFDKAQAEALKTAYNKFDFPVPFSNKILACYAKWNQHWWGQFELRQCTKEELQLFRFRDFALELGLRINIELLNSEYKKALSEGRFLIPGALSLLRELKEKYHIHIITNGVSATQYSRIEKSPLMPYIDGIYVSEDTGYAKPAKEYFDYVLKKAGIKCKEQCLVIGDSLSSDIQGANNAGIDCLWFNPANLKNPGLKINGEIKELPEILSYLNS